jgi:hypothetical protein
VLQLPYNAYVMRLEQVKTLPLVFISIIMLLSSVGIAHADSVTRPYLKGFGADVMTGGWFSNGTDCQMGAGTSNYQSPSFYNASFPSADNRNGGILSYSKSSGNSTGGDSSQYAAFSVGEIDGRRAGPPHDGFYSAGSLAATTSTSVKALSFANNSAALSFGGVFDGTVSQGNCIADYYSKKPSSTQNINNLSDAIAAPNSVTDFSASAVPGTNFNLTNGAASFTIPAGKRITIYVNGNVYINANILYDAASTVDNVPKFALIASGSIYIDKNATQLAGMYVAEPSVTTAAAVAADNGIIWTCHPNNTAVLDYTYPPNCTSPLVVSGGLIAKQINYFRIGGNNASTKSDVATTSSTAEDNISTVNTCSSSPYNNCHLSEVVNYTPAMIMGGTFISGSGGSSGSGGGLPVDSVLSLPPVF